MKDLPFSFYEFLAVLMPGFVLTVTLLYLLGPMPHVSGNEILPILYVLCVSYLSGQVLAQASLTLIEFPTRKLLGEPALIILGQTKRPRVRKLLFPFYFDLIHPSQSDSYLQLIGSRKREEILTRTYQLALTRARAQSDIRAQLDRWNRMSAFSRNMMMAALVIAFTAVWQWHSRQSPTLFIAGWATLFGATLYYRYLRFFRIYSLELIHWFSEQKLPLQIP